MKICYEDNHIIIVYKPRNMLSQKDYTNDDSLVEEVKSYLKLKYNKPGNVYLGLLHRLDRVVGGIMLLAKTSKAAERLSKDIKNNKINKTYLAVKRSSEKPVQVFRRPFCRIGEYFDSAHACLYGIGSYSIFNPIRFFYEYNEIIFF